MEKTGSKLTNLPDIELIGLALDPDSPSNQMAFVVLYKRYENGVRAHISRFTKQREDVEDICMESFQKAFCQLSLYKKEYQFSTWLYRIAQNTTFDHLNKKALKDSYMPTTSMTEGQDELSNLADDSISPEEDIINQEVSNKWMDNISKLKEGYREVARMYLIENYGYQEIADALGLPLNTVRTKIRRSRALLEKMMDVSDELL